MTTAQEVSEGLADFRVEVSERFGRVEKELAAVQTELGLIRKIGDRLLGAMVAGVGTMFVWAALAGWYGSAISSEVKHQGERIDKVEKRLDAIDQKLDTLIGRGAPKSGG